MGYEVALNDKLVRLFAFWGHALLESLPPGAYGGRDVFSDVSRCLDRQIRHEVKQRNLALFEFCTVFDFELAHGFPRVSPLVRGFFVLSGGRVLAWS